MGKKGQDFCTCVYTTIDTKKKIFNFKICKLNFKLFLQKLYDMG